MYLHAFFFFPFEYFQINFIVVFVEVALEKAILPGCMNFKSLLDQ